MTFAVDAFRDVVFGMSYGTDHVTYFKYRATTDYRMCMYITGNNVTSHFLHFVCYLNVRVR